MYDKVKSKNLVVSKEFYVLGTTNILKAFGENAETAIYKAMKKLLEIDDKMSVFKTDSEFSKINLNSGVSAVSVSDDTYNVIKKALGYAFLSYGAFNPAIKPVIDLWDSVKNGHEVISKEDVTEKLKLTDYKDIILNDSNNSIKLMHKGQSIDGGSIVKGFAADKVRDIFIENGVENAVIDLGGNISVMGMNIAADMLWRVGIQNPLGNRGDFVGVLTVKDKSVVTSGEYERCNHIIDPRTGYPSNNGVISATIVSGDSVDADALSTCAYVLGVDEAVKFIKSLKYSDMILITEDRKIYITSGIKDNFRLTDSTFTLKNI